MKSLPPIAEDIYVRITYPSFRLVKEYRTWDVETQLKTIRERHESATVTQIDHPTYLKELHRASRSN